MSAEKVTVTVRATKPGFHDGRRRVGDVFEFAAPAKDGKPVLGSWMELVASSPLADKRKPKSSGEQKTLAEGGKDIGADLV